MDAYPKSTVDIRELSRASSMAASNSHANPPPSPTLSKTSSTSTRHSCEAPRYLSTTPTRESESLTSFPPPSNFSHTVAFDSHVPPAYRDEDFEGKSKDEVRRMRKRDYAVQISRLMGRQLVRGVNGKGGER